MIIEIKLKGLNGISLSVFTCSKLATETWSKPCSKCSIETQIKQCSQTGQFG